MARITCPAALTALSGLLVACGPNKGETVTPEPPAPVAQAPEEPSEPPPNPRRVGDDAVAVGTFNLQWAHSPSNPKASKLAKKFRAQNPDDWTWKVNEIAKVLVEQKLDVIALQEVGGESEVIDIKFQIAELGGPDYFMAWVKSEDQYTGHQVAVLSRYPIIEERRLDIHLRKHIAVDIELPDESIATFVAIHARGGRYASQEKARAKQARALKRKIEQLRKQQPVVILGTANSAILPDDPRYATSSAGVLAGAHTKKDTDDCQDSGSFLTGQETTVAGDLADRIISCGLALRDAEASADEAIVRDEPDPADAVWSQVPIEGAPYRDVSDHLVLWAEVGLPEPKPEGDDAAVAGQAASP